MAKKSCVKLDTFDKTVIYDALYVLKEKYKNEKAPKTKRRIKTLMKKFEWIH